MILAVADSYHEIQAKLAGKGKPGLLCRQLFFRVRNRQLLLTSGLAVAGSLIALAAAFGLLEASSPRVDVDSSTCGTASLHYCSDCIATGYDL